MKLTTSLSFKGQCEAAFKFYEERLAAKTEFMLTWGESPLADQVPSEWRAKVLHARITIGDSELVGADVPPDEYRQPQGFAVLLSIDDHSTAERTFEALAEGGDVRLPIQETFWALRYGVVVDRFGIPWDINCERPQ